MKSSSQSVPLPIFIYSLQVFAVFISVNIYWKLWSILKSWRKKEKRTVIEKDNWCCCCLIVCFRYCVFTINEKTLLWFFRWKWILQQQQHWQNAICYPIRRRRWKEIKYFLGSSFCIYFIVVTYFVYVFVCQNHFWKLSDLIFPKKEKNSFD